MVLTSLLAIAAVCMLAVFFYRWWTREGRIRLSEPLEGELGFGSYIAGPKLMVVFLDRGLSQVKKSKWTNKSITRTHRNFTDIHDQRTKEDRDRFMMGLATADVTRHVCCLDDDVGNYQMRRRIGVSIVPRSSARYGTYC